MNDKKNEIMILSDNFAQFKQKRGEIKIKSCINTFIIKHLQHYGMEL